MDDFQEKLGSILNDPQMMSQIMSMAQAMGNQSTPQQETPPPQPRQSAPPQQNMPEIDFAMLQKLSGLARQNSIDKDQQALLRALSPYLHKDRISKLEKAMRAAKMARFASSALGQGGLQSLLGGR